MARKRPKQDVATGALVKVHACVDRHRLDGRETAMRASNSGFECHGAHGVWRLTNLIIRPDAATGADQEVRAPPATGLC